jgi:hypothetical protein
MVAGDVAMLEHEVTPGLKALRANGIDVVAIHHQMTGTQPVGVYPAHHYATGPVASWRTVFWQRSTCWEDARRDVVRESR